MERNSQLGPSEEVTQCNKYELHGDHSSEESYAERTVVENPKDYGLDFGEHMGIAHMKILPKWNSKGLVHYP